ncbi:hypothetical protein [Winogradskyella sp. 3972H.M.0a.05]|uniref:hypothetical protein n=1 Tax=Winogradskyella sp. 3972H.M.0a.05 TaxID=2950277 RepID=UPI003395A77F
MKAVGNDSTETKIIDSLGYKTTFKDFSSLNIETDSLKTRLQNLGYLATNLTNLSRVNDSLYKVTYNLNKRYNLVRVSYDIDIDKKLLEALAKNVEDDYFEVDINNLERVLTILNKQISEEGDPFSTLRLTNIIHDNGNLTADLQITKKDISRSIDSIIIKGYEKFPKSFIKRYLKIRTNQPFNLYSIKEKTAALDNLRFSRQIREPEVLFTKDSTIIYIYVEKVKSNSFDGFLGFGTNEDTNKLEFDGYLNLILNNNLNFGESFRLLYKSDENDQRTFDVKANLPYLFGSPLDVELGLNIFRKDSTFSNVSQTANIAYNIDPRNRLGLGIFATTSSNLLDNGTSTLDDYTSNFYLANYTHTRLQNYDALFPVNFLFDISAGFGKRTFESVDEAQTRFTLNTYKIFNLNQRNSIYARINGAYLDSENYLENELFRFGGINSIRGFEENSLTANLFAVLNTEYRYRLNSSIYVHSVIDASYSENNIANTKSKLFGFGFGFGLLSKAGLFKFNYTSAKTENQKFRLSDSKVHISLTAQF